ncbi:MAG: hypothetical protein LBS41_00595 [Streptococcaceae bacterium]|jgi:hypothetical protein|nr:hypothetical protein [Streptococcaceae bacterium]
MKDLNAILVVVAGTLPIILTTLKQILETRKKERADDVRELLALRSTLQEKSVNMIDAGASLTGQLEVYKALYERYLELGGNSEIKILHDKVLALPIDEKYIKIEELQFQNIQVDSCWLSYSNPLNRDDLTYLF